MLCRTDKPDDDGTDIYVGSTSKPLKERLRKHRSNAKNFLKRGYTENHKLYTRMNDVGVWNWNTIPLVMFACDQKTIFEFQRDWIQILKTDLNMIFPVTDRKKYKAEYRKNNKDAIRKRNAERYEGNKNTTLRQQAEYRKNNVGVKKYHCDVCDISFGHKKDLGKHLDTLKHSYASMNSVD